MKQDDSKRHFAEVPRHCHGGNLDVLLLPISAARIVASGELCSRQSSSRQTKNDMNADKMNGLMEWGAPPCGLKSEFILKDISEGARVCK